jgi:hypothetical protein
MKEKEAMKNQRLPRGWTQKRIRELANHHDQHLLAEPGSCHECNIAGVSRARIVTGGGSLPFCSTFSA